MENIFDYSCKNCLGRIHRDKSGMDFHEDPYEAKMSGILKSSGLLLNYNVRPITK